MNIVMMTNSYIPLVGGMESSIRSFSRQYRSKGHNVLVVAPEYDDMPPDEEFVMRLPAIRNINDVHFSLALPVPAGLHKRLDAFEPDIVHSHHPFLLGDTAIRAAARFRVPLVYTNHTLWEGYRHYLYFESKHLMRFVTALITGYANLCDMVFTPSESIRDMMAAKGVKVPIEVIPTGVDLRRFSTGEGAAFRRSQGIPDGARLIGTVSRIEPEKNIEFLAKSVAMYLKRDTEAHFAMVGSGGSLEGVGAMLRGKGFGGRVHLPGTLQGNALVDAYCAMDVFLFASKTETQGLVLLESMACHVPVIGLAAPGVREVVSDGVNGFLLKRESQCLFAQALDDYFSLPPERMREMRMNARKTAERFSEEECADKALSHYERLIRRKEQAGAPVRRWEEARAYLRAEWDILLNITRAARGFVEREKNALTVE